MVRVSYCRWGGLGWNRGYAVQLQAEGHRARGVVGQALDRPVSLPTHLPTVVQMPVKAEGPETQALQRQPSVLQDCSSLS